MNGILGKPLRAGLYGASVVLVGVAVYWAALPDSPRVASVSPAADAAAPAFTHPQSGTSQPQEQESTQERTQGQPPAGAPIDTPIDTEIATVAQYTAQKYRFLLDDLRSPGVDRDHLQAVLLQREQLTGLPEGEGRERALAEADARIRGLLHPADFATFDALKDSDLEQFELEEYAGGVSNVAPLSDEDRRAILRTKLAYKGRFRQLVRDSGLLRKDMSPAERDYAYGVTSRALQAYQESYLQEVRQYLSNDEQYTLLSNYESTRFSDELAKLRATANGS